MNEKISFIKKFKISIISIQGYKVLIKQKLSRALLYSILLSLIIGLIQGIFTFVSISTMQKSIEKAILSDEFKFTFQDGILDFENSPIKREQGKSLIYIDTNTSIEEKDAIRKIVVHKDVSVAILKDGISFRINGDEEEIKFEDIQLDEKIDNQTLLKSLNIISLVKYISFISSLIIPYVIFMFNSFILSIFGMLLNSVKKAGLNYKKIFKISIYCTTLPSIIRVIIPIGILGLFISGIYLILVINYLAREIKL